MKHKLGYDDSLDAFGIHCFGGIVGALLTGTFFNNTIFADESEIGSQLLIQAKDVIITIAYSGTMSVVILKVVSLFCGSLRVEKDDERQGLDISIHGERIE